MAGYQVRAIMSLAAPEEGGLVLALPSGTPSLILEFSNGGSVTQLGAIVTTEGGEQLQSGAMDSVVTLEFWADDARRVAMPGSEFGLWYGGHVGRGRVQGPSPLPEEEAGQNDG